MKPRSIVVVLAIVAFVAKLYCAATTFGSSDVWFYWHFSGYIQEHGLIEMYRSSPAYNHTPIVGWFVAAIGALARAQGQPELFNFYLRLPAILADLVSVLVLVRFREKIGRPSWLALGLFALSPVSFMVSGFHGNVDPLLTAALLFAALACIADRPILCGLFFGVSCNIKVVPLLLFPALFFYWFQRCRHWRFSLPAAGVTLAGWSVPLFAIPAIFIKNVLGYASIWGTWGITYGLRLTHLPQFSDVAFSFNGSAAWHRAITIALQVVIVGSVLIWSWHRRRAEPMGIFKTVAVCFALFFVFAPGFGPQYLVWPAPFFLLASESWFVAVTLSSSLALFVFYNALSGGRLPWDRALDYDTTVGVWAPWLVPSWLVLVAYLGSVARLGFDRPAQTTDPAPVVDAAEESVTLPSPAVPLPARGEA